MRAFRLFLTLLVTIGFIFSWLPPAAAQTIPNGYQLRTDPGGTAALLVTQRYGNSATHAVALGLAEIATAFDGKPVPLGGFRDTQDQRAEVGFHAFLRRMLVSGIGFATLAGGVATVGFAFDGLQAPPTSMIRLLQQVGYVSADSGPASWRLVQYPDGSGSIRLPDGWQIESASKGAVAAAGPQGRIFKAIHITAMTRANAAATEQLYRTTGVPPHVISQTFAGIIVADPVDAVSAMIAVESQTVAKYGDGSFRFLRLIQVVPVPPPPPLAHAALIDYEFMMKGVRDRALQYVTVSNDFGNGTWGYYTSGLASRSEAFARNFSLLYEILLSAQTAQHTIQEKWDSALDSLSEAGEIRRQAQVNQSQTMVRVHADRVEVIRGRRLVEDTATGQRVDANLAYIREIVRELNAREGPGRYVEIPARDLVR